MSPPTASVFSVARYIRERVGAVESRKLQKLVYYVQAWSTVWRQRPAFPERMEAWIDGPVSPDLWADAMGVSGSVRAAADLTPDDRTQVDRVLAIYGGMSARELIELSHDERPWRDARGDLEPSARSQAVITPEAMAAYYSACAAEADADALAIANPTFLGTAAELDALLPQ